MNWYNSNKLLILYMFLNNYYNLYKCHLQFQTCEFVCLSTLAITYSYHIYYTISKHNRLGRHSFLNGGAPQSWPRATSHLLSSHPPTTHHLTSTATRSPVRRATSNKLRKEKSKKHFQLLPQGTKRAHMISDMTRHARVCMCVCGDTYLGHFQFRYRFR